MSIGFLDWDLTRWRQPTIFSLEIMKLAYHYKRNREIVRMLPSFETDRDERVYVYKDYEDYVYPKDIMSNPKAIVRGLAMTNNVYVPMDDEIEFTRADPTIYKPHERYYLFSEQSRRVFRTMLGACHLRMSTNGESVSPLWYQQLTDRTDRVQHVIVHDTDISRVSGSGELLKEIHNHFGERYVRVGFKYPVKVYSDDELLLWGRMQKSSSLSNLYLMNSMSDMVIDDVSLLKQSYTYYFSQEHWTKESLIEEVPRLFLQALYLGKWGSRLGFSIDPLFDIENEWRQLFELLSDYQASSVTYRGRPTFSVFTYTKHIYPKLQREEKVALFQFIEEQCPKLFDYLYNVEYVELEKEVLKPRMYTWEKMGEPVGLSGQAYRQSVESRERQMLQKYNYAETISPNDIRGGI